MEDRKQLYSIGIKPIVSETYDPNCTMPFTLGLVELLKSATQNPTGKQIWYYMLKELTISGCVDKDVISGVINYGSEYAVDDIDLSQYLNVVYRLVHTVNDESLHQPWNKGGTPNDSRCAALIDAGLLHNVCMKLLLRFKSSNNGQICHMLRDILQGFTSVATHDKTSKAIANARVDIEEALRDPYIMDLARNNALCGHIVNMIAYLARDFNLEDSKEDEEVTCNNCNKLLEKDEIKRCR